MDIYRSKAEKEKRRKKIKTKIFVFFTAVFILAAASSAVYAVGYSGLFKIKKISVSGLSGVSAERFEAEFKDFLIQNSKLSAFLGAGNILSWFGDTSEFFKKYPQFSRFSVKKDFFKREIIIKTEERNKFGLWCLKGVEEAANKCFWFDKNGIIFLEAPIVETELLRKVNDYTGRYFKIGDSILSQNLAENLTGIFIVIDKAGIASKTLDLNDIGLEEVVLEPLAGTPKIYFSLKFNSEFAISAIKELKESGKWPVLKYVDFRSENRAYYK